uniref:G-protein coupled receptors family 1 profile domain-containing protein n=1 Tax=Ascaris lumbricoides TaxID=6252 RepID=A0A9J2PSI3_ASCLU
MSIYGVELTMLSFFIERAIAVLFYSKYEKSTSIKLASILIFLQIIPHLHLIYGLVPLIGLHILLVINNIRLRRCEWNNVADITRSLQLGEKYQLQENRQSIRSLLPLFWVTFLVLNTNALAAICMQKIDHKLSATHFIIYVDIFKNITIVLPFCVCALTLMKFTKLREKFNFGQRQRQVYLSTRLYMYIIYIKCILYILYIFILKSI